ncbi:MAG: serine/threonine protein kinase psk1 [Heterodermia speciosa]|uniref:Serine/threonine protein kinase psk1 n=1 Tax=Heterodermia speciosa TaxID=116794 RepID=A0A8H3IZD5_9LECA|nr:MAG: serine/threonine protein kinase psk1 [Heterodermia speciosa]
MQALITFSHTQAVHQAKMLAFKQPPVTFLPRLDPTQDPSQSTDDTVADEPANLNLGNGATVACDGPGLILEAEHAPHPTVCKAEENDTLGGFATAVRSDLGDAGTPPIDISTPPTATRGRPAAVLDLSPIATNLTGRAHRKKKRAKKQGALAALNAARVGTPINSCDEDSDFSSGSIFKKRDLSATRTLSITSNPGVRSSSPCGSISALTRQLDTLSIEQTLQKPSMLRNKSKLGTGTSSSASLTSEAPSEEEITSYEIPLEHDFISPDAPRPGFDVFAKGLLLDQISRKMTATDFEPLRCLGKGTYGTVILVKHVATGRLYAQKQFRKASLTVRKQLVEQTKTERTILESINRHPFVVKLYYAFQDHEKLYLILEYAQGGELFTRMLTERMFSEETASFYMAEMVLALEHLHQTVGVVYRDLKPENCLLDSEGHLLLTDFGLSKVAVDGDYRCRSMTGTLEYMAPEVILQNHYDTAVDWWSFGILGFDMLTGYSPFSANNETKIKEKILKSKLVLPYYLSADAKDLLTRLLRKEPRKRLGANMPKDMQTIKSHRFFRKIDWKRLEKRELEPPIKPLITDPELAENFSADFTDLALSPVCGMEGKLWMDPNELNPFGGFSFVASSSVLESGHGFF